MKRKGLKGFTLVELLVTVSILATLTTVSVVSYVSFTNKAKVSNDISLVTQLNNYLKADGVLESKPRMPSQVLERLSESGVDIDLIRASAKGHQILWNQETNTFVLMNREELVFGEPASQACYYWKFIEEKEEHSPYSLYLKGTTFSGELEIQAGLDVGENDHLEKVYYLQEQEEQKDIVIRTTENNYESALVVKGPLDTISHYGNLASLHIESIANDCYHEFGKILGEVRIDEGKFILEDGSVLNGQVTKGEDATTELEKGVKWSQPTYTWSKDNKTCTAYRTDENHLVEDEEETVNSYLFSEEKETCLEDGSQTIKVDFKNPVFLSQEKVITLPKHAHQFYTIPEIPATCSKTGMSQGSQCKECGLYDVVPQETPFDKSNHNRDSHGFCVDCEKEMASKDWKDVSINDYTSASEIEKLFKESNYIFLTSDVEFGIKSTIQIPVSVKGERIINLNRHTIHIDKVSGTPSFKVTGDNVQFINGKIESNFTSTIIEASGKGSHLTLENMEIVNTNSGGNCVKAEASGTIEIKNSKITTPADSATRTAITVLSGLDSKNPCKVIVSDHSEINGNIETQGGPANGGNIEIVDSVINGTVTNFGDKTVIRSSQINDTIITRSGTTEIQNTSFTSLDANSLSKVKIENSAGSGSIDISDAGTEVTLNNTNVAKDVSVYLGKAYIYGGKFGGNMSVKNTIATILEIHDADINGSLYNNNGSMRVYSSIIHGSLKTIGGLDELTTVENSTLLGSISCKLGDLGKINKYGNTSLKDGYYKNDPTKCVNTKQYNISKTTHPSFSGTFYKVVKK